MSENIPDELSEFYQINKKLTDDALKLHDTFQQAYNKILSGGGLSSGEATKLIGLYPALADSVTSSADKYYIDAQRLIEANDALTASASDTYERQMEFLQKYRDNASQQEIPDLNTQIAAFEKMISMFDIVTLDQNDTAERSSQTAQEITSHVKLIDSAAKEMNKSGSISSDTYQKLVKAGSDFAECAEIVNGSLTVNVDKLKELETQQYKNALSANSLKESQLRLQAQTAAQSGGDWQTISTEISRLESEDKLYTAILSDIGNISSAADTPAQEKSSAEKKTASVSKQAVDKTDYSKTGFNQFMGKYENAHDRGFINDEEYLNALELANEKYYKDSQEHLSDYDKNVTKIYNGRKKLYEQDAQNSLDALDRSLADGVISYGEYAEKVRALAEEYFGEGSTYYGLELASGNYQKLNEKADSADEKERKQQTEQQKKAFDKTLEELNEIFQKGFIGAEEYSQKYNELIDTSRALLTDDEYKKHSDKANDPDRIYEEKLRQLELSDDGSLESAKNIAEKRTELAKELYETTNPNKYRTELEGTAKYELSAIKTAYSEERLSAKEYETQINELYNRMTGLGGALPASFVSSAVIPAEQVKRLLNEWDAQNPDADQKDKIDYMRLIADEYGVSEYKRKADELELELYKSQIKQDKKDTEDYYNGLIQKAKEHKKSLDEVNEAQQRLTEIVKAQNELEDISAQRNTLVFQNGGYEYVSDPQAMEAAAQKLEKLKISSEKQLLPDETLSLTQEKLEALKAYDDLLSRAEIEGISFLQNAAEEKKTASSDSSGDVTINGGVSISMSENTPTKMIAEFADKLSAAVLAAAKKIR